MSSLREKCIRAITEAIQRYGSTRIPNKSPEEEAERIFDAVLAVLGEHADEWQAQAHDAWQVGPIDDDREWWDYLLAVLADPEEVGG